VLLIVNHLESSIVVVTPIIGLFIIISIPPPCSIPKSHFVRFVEPHAAAQIVIYKFTHRQNKSVKHLIYLRIRINFNIVSYFKYICIAAAKIAAALLFIVDLSP
jgi:hypothetical protein